MIVLLPKSSSMSLRVGRKREEEALSPILQYLILGNMDELLSTDLLDDLNFRVDLDSLHVCASIQLRPKNTYERDTGH